MLMRKRDEWYNGYQGVRFEFTQQATCRYRNGGHGRVDLAANVFMPTKITGGNRYHFEIKSCKSDLDTDRGLNLFATYNYLVYPKLPITTLPGIITYEMVEQKLKDIGCEHAGIIAVISDDDFIVERKARRYNGDGAPPAIKAYQHKNCRILPNTVQSK